MINDIIKIHEIKHKTTSAYLDVSVLETYLRISSGQDYINISNDIFYKAFKSEVRNLKIENLLK